MRYFIACVALLFIYSGCSSTETSQQPVQQEPVTQPSEKPSWYSDGIHSSADSLSLHGYSMASATDSLRSAELSSQQAIEYLRFEIDRTVEELRGDLAESQGGSTYNSSSFIIRLRRTVSELPLDSATYEQKHTVSDTGVHYVYSRVSISKEALYTLFENRLQDNRFLQEIRSFSH